MLKSKVLLNKDQEMEFMTAFMNEFNNDERAESRNNTRTIQLHRDLTYRYNLILGQKNVDHMAGDLIDRSNAIRLKVR